MPWIRNAFRPHGPLRRNAPLLAAVGFSLVLLGANALLVHRSSRALRASTDRVARTIQVQAEISRLFSEVQDVESGARGFALTGSNRYLEPYDAARARIPEDLEVLRRLVADNATQEKSFGALSKAIAERLQWPAAVVAAIRADESERARALIRTGSGFAAMGRVRALVQAMRDEESRLLALRQAEALLASHHADRDALVALLIDALLVAGLVVALIRVDRMRGLVKVCAWSKTIQHDGRWLSFEEYLQERYGLTITHGLSESAAARLMAELDSEPGARGGRDAATGLPTAPPDP